MPRLSIVLTQPQIDILQDLSKKTGMRTSEILRRAVDLYLNQNRLPQYRPDAFTSEFLTPSEVRKLERDN